MKRWEQRACPSGTWDFRTRLGGNHAHTHALPPRGPMLLLGPRRRPDCFLTEPHLIPFKSGAGHWVPMRILALLIEGRATENGS